MKSRQGMVFLGDLVRAMSVFDVRDKNMLEEAATLVRMRLDSKPIPPKVKKGDERDDSLSRQPVRQEKVEPPPSPGTASNLLRRNPRRSKPEPYSDTSQKQKADDVEFTHRSLRSEFSVPPAVDVMKLARATLPALSHQPLFGPRWVRGVLREALASLRTTDDVDVGKVVDIFAKCEPLEPIPKTTTLSLSLGCQIVMECGRPLQPFFLDRQQLIEGIQSVAGRGLVEVVRFEGCPRAGVVERGGRLRSYAAPPPGTPVLLVTELGLSGVSDMLTLPAAPGDWVRFSSYLEQHKCPLVAVVPYPAWRCPAEIRKAFVIILWDRSTTALAVRRARESKVLK